MSQLSIGDIQTAVVTHYGISLDDLRGPRKYRPLVHQRQLAMYLTRLLLGSSYPVLGRHFNRDHSTTLYACRVIGARLQSDSRLVSDAISILESIQIRWPQAINPLDRLRGKVPGEFLPPTSPPAEPWSQIDVI